MTTPTEKVWFITGGARGFGRELVEEVLKRGHKVAVTARNLGPLAELKSNLKLLALEADVNSKASIEGAVKKAGEHFGRLDVVVNNAGYGLFGPVEDLSDEELEAQLQTNLFGPLRVVRAAMPILRQSGGGNILQISSIAGFVGSAGGGPYHASKFALEGLSEALAGEALASNVKVTIVSPGGFRTGFAANESVRFTKADREETAAMSKMVRARISAFSGNQMGDPKEAVRVLFELTELADPPLHLFLGEDALVRARAKLDYMRGETVEFEKLSKTKPFADAASLGHSPFGRPWKK